MISTMLFLILPIVGVAAFCLYQIGWRGSDRWTLFSVVGLTAWIAFVGISGLVD